MPFLPIFILFLSFNAMSQGTYPTTGSIERLDPKMNSLIAPNAVIEVLSNGFIWTEGPLYIEDGDYWLFQIYHRIVFLNGMKKRGFACI